MDTDTETSLDRLYRQGYEVGLVGIRSACPIEIYDNPDRELRNAWIKGYLNGMKAYNQSLNELRGHRGNPALNMDWHTGKMYVVKHKGVFLYCNEKTQRVYCRLRISDAMVILEPESAYEPEDALYLSKAVAKASSAAYRLRELRKKKI